MHSGWMDFKPGLRYHWLACSPVSVMTGMLGGGQLYQSTPVHKVLVSGVFGRPSLYTDAGSSSLDQSLGAAFDLLTLTLFSTHICRVRQQSVFFSRN